MNGYDDENNQRNKYPRLSNLHQESQDPYLMIDQNGNTRVVNKSELNNPNHSFRKFKKTKDFGQESNSSRKLFTDYTFDLKEQENKNIDPQRGNVIIKRLSQLYSGNSQVQLFPTINRIVNFKNPNDLPHAIHQLQVMPMQHYKSFFITQNFAKNGRYHVLINKDGRFENQFVDDFIPIYQKTNQPIWQMDLNQPWKLILLKVWAKTLRGYENINKSQYFKFIQAFSNSNWKYWNLTKSLNKKSELETFLKTYTNRKLSAKQGRILLRTRTSQAVSQSGLILGRVAYELLEIKETEKQKQYLVTIRSFNKHRWAGQMSVIDQKLNLKHRNDSVHPVKLEHDMVMNHKDFGNLFASSFICAKDRFQSYFSNFIQVNVSSTNTRAKFIKFTIHQQGLFDFCIKQSERNKVKAGQKTKLIINQREGNNQRNRSQEEARDRYLHTKYMLARVRGINDRENQEEQRQNLKNSTIKQSEKDYNPLTYELYEAQYLRGYNRGDAHFLQVTKGQYILRLKCENSSKESNYFINYGCNSRPTVQEVSLSEYEHQQFLRDCFMTIMHYSTKAHTDKSTKLDDITIYDNIEKYGYCFIGVRIKKKADYNLLLEIRPQEIYEGGYTIKGKFKSEKQPFAIEVKPGQYTSILLKTMPNLKSYKISQNAYQLFKKKI